MTDTPSMQDGWQDISTAPEGIPVETKIDYQDGVRNGQILQRRGRLWWTRGETMYVYYTPTHWRPAPPKDSTT